MDIAKEIFDMAVSNIRMQAAVAQGQPIESVRLDIDVKTDDTFFQVLGLDALD